MTLIIIDANVASEFGPSQTEEAKYIASWLSRHGFLATGGKNLSELAKTVILDFVNELRRAGRVQLSDNKRLEMAERKFTKNIRSNDRHVIVLARVSKARVLYTRDRSLMEDFKNKELINKPRGKCFSSASLHQHLLPKG